jgi:gliding motility-associated-like protein
LPAGLVLNSGTGAINLATSTVGTYTITYSFASGGCSNTTITAVTVNPPPSATISYTGSPFCATGTKTVTRTGTAGGTYSSTTGLIIDATTGTIDLAASTAGLYTITYTIAAAGSCPLFTTSTSITINALPVATISYAGSPFCATGTGAVTRTGTAGGSYSALPAGLIVNASTGSINLATSAPGTYIVTYAFTSAAGCANTTSTSVTVNALPTATISYTGSPFCATGTVTVNQTGTTGGAYTSTAGLTINGSTGLINLATSTAGTYTVTYSFSSATTGCINTATTTVTITALPAATISYAGSPFCATGTGAVTRTGTAGGAYSALPAGLSINTVTGLINLVSSAPGTYTVTYSFTNAAGCANSASTSVTINALPTAAISYAGSPFCGIGTTSVTQTGTAGGAYTSTAGLTINGTTGLINLAASTAGTYTVTYTFSSAAGCTNTATTSLVIEAAPSATISYTGSPFCATGTGTVTRTGTAGGTYTSTVGLSINALTGAINLATSIPGTYTITYTIAATASCPVFTTTTTATINALPTAAISYTGSPFCGIGTASVTQTGTAGGTYTSTAGLSITGTTGLINLATSTAGTYTVTYTFTSGCTNTATASITINAAPLATISASGPLSICSGSPVTLTANSGVGLSYQWQNAGTNIAGATTSTLIVNTAGSYTVTVTNASGCSTVSSASVVTLTASITPTFTPISPICSGGTFTLNALSNNNIFGGWSPSVNNTATTLYTFTPLAGQCATTTTMTVTVNAPVTPNFVQVGPICSGGVITLPTTSPNSITGVWSPAVNNTATTTYSFTPAAGQCATTATMTVVVNPIVTPIFTQIAPICVGATLTLPPTSNNGITGSWTPTPNNSVTTTYTFTPTAGQCATATTTMTVVVNPIVTSSFTQIPPVCFGSVITIPTTDLSGITGTWSPAFNSTSSSSYLFTPTAGQCATTAFMAIDITTITTTTFTQIAPICSGAVLTLPPISNESITGTWSPAVNNTATTTYTFTPATGQCATTATMTVVVNPIVTPIFTQIAPICVGGTLTLPPTSNNGIAGVWTPTVNNSATTTYTFTPTAGQCATATTTMTVVVNPIVTPSFTQIPPVCFGTVITIPTTDLNGITGVWSPAFNSTSSSSYLFTPTAGQCATTAFMAIDIIPNATTIFTQVGPICSGTSVAALPTTSTNGIIGSWLPTAINNIATTTYTFTPNTTSCGTSTTMTITVNPNITPTFTQIGPICSGAALTLPTTSNNGITGGWTGVVNNTATTTYTFTPTAGQCATTTTMTVVVNPNLTTSFAPVGPICAGAVVGSLPVTDLTGITGTWTPAVINNTASTSYLFTPTAGQCASIGVLTINVLPNVVPSFNAISPICSGGTFSLSPTDLTGIFGSWTPAFNNTATTTYTFTPFPLAGQCVTTTTMTVTVNPNITPTFTAVGPICTGQTGSTLQVPSNEGINGTWLPNTINNTVTTTYDFIPSTGQCAIGTNLIVVVNPIITPTFTQVAPICSGATIGVLPTTDLTGITGIWSPSSINNTATTTYTFTPDAGQCATTTTMTIVVNPIVTPTFTPVSTICFGASLTLPTTDLTGVTGTWNPSVVNSTASTSYLFTPDAGQCATFAFMGISVVPNVIPTFNTIAPICSGASLVLPNPSNNSITGTWLPLIDNTATTTYTFTPDAGQCAVTASMTVVVNPNVTPIFAPVGPICSGAVLSPLPPTDPTGIPGSWTPTLNNVITTNYTFTPDPGICATSQTLTITVNPNVTPTFAAVGPICAGATLSPLPLISNEGINGTWSPNSIDNTATTTYTFTPAAGECAVPTTLTIVVNPILTPTFTTTTTICSGSAYTLPLISNESISGTWNSAFDNTVSATYTFTPDAGQCGTVTTLSITVNPNVLPTFAAVGPICAGATLSALPLISLEGITGTWDIPVNNTVTTTYTFTPTPGLCALPATLTIVVNPNVTPTFAPVGPICIGTVLSPLPAISNEGITGTWDLALNNTATTTYTFTPDAGQCALTTTLTITVNQLTVPMFNQVASICAGATLTALPIIDLTGITGAWSPALNNLATTTYTFTPTVGQCADVATMTITVNPIVTPTFTTTTTICSGAAYTLPLISDEGINGTWAPTFSNTASGTYTFTPNAGQCGTVTTLSITVIPNVQPTFAAVSPICAGGTLSALPLISIEGIAGTWDVPVNNTVTTTYTFTPTSGVCALSASLTIVVNPIVTPTFAAVGPICLGDPVVALPTTSNEAIVGAWSPIAVDNTVTTTYTFTPDAGQCAIPTTMTIVVNPIPSLSVTPTVDEICSGEATIISITTSPVGASADWTVIENGTSGATAGSGNTINQTLSTTSQIDGTATYSIVPTLNGCAGSAVDLIVTVHPIVDASFTASNYCDGIGVAPVITGDAGGTFTFTPPVTDGATIDPSTGLISNGVLGTTYIIQYAVVGICPAATQQAVSFNAVPVSPNTGNDTSYCSNEIFVSMTASSNNGGNLNWFDDAALTNNIGSGTNVIPANVLGISTYYVTETVNGCQSAPETVYVTVFKLPAAPVLSIDTTYCYGDTLQKVFVTGTLGGIYNWYDDAALTNLIGNTDSILPNNVIGISTYYATETSIQGCESLPSSVSVTINDCYVLDVSSAFTPDGDGINDTWLIAELSTRYPNNNVTIFNRWGQVLYNSDGYLIPWDGKFDNKDLPVGSYYYIIDFNDALDTPNATGIVTIIRN